MKSKKGSAMLGKFLFYFGNTLIGIVFFLFWQHTDRYRIRLASDLDDLRFL